MGIAVDVVAQRASRAGSDFDIICISLQVRPRVLRENRLVTSLTIVTSNTMEFWHETKMDSGCYRWTAQQNGRSVVDGAVEIRSRMMGSHSAALLAGFSDGVNCKVR